MTDIEVIKALLPKLRAKDMSLEGSILIRTWTSWFKRDIIILELTPNNVALFTSLDEKSWRREFSCQEIPEALGIYERLLHEVQDLRMKRILKIAGIKV